MGQLKLIKCEIMAVIKLNIELYFQKYYLDLAAHNNKIGDRSTAEIATRTNLVCYPLAHR